MTNNTRDNNIRDNKKKEDNDTNIRFIVVLIILLFINITIIVFNARSNVTCNEIEVLDINITNGNDMIYMQVKCISRIDKEFGVNKICAKRYQDQLIKLIYDFSIEKNRINKHMISYGHDEKLLWRQKQLDDKIKMIRKLIE